MFYQLLRISNTLNYHLHLLNEYINIDEKMRLYVLIEESCIVLSTIQESMKILFSDKSKEIINEIITNEKEKIKYQNLFDYYGRYKIEKNLIIMEHIRSNLQFHLSNSIYKDVIKEGQQEKDILLCDVCDNNFSKIIFFPPLNISINSIECIMKANGIEGDVIINVIELVNNETNRIYNFVYQLIYNTVNDNFLA